MPINIVSKDELYKVTIDKILKVDVVLDIGCGINPQNYLVPFVHICCEPFEEYVEVLQNKINCSSDRKYIVLKAGWADAVELFPKKSVDTVFLVDVIEHLEKEAGLRLLKATEAIAKRQIVVFTPLGFMPQHHPNGIDAWGLKGANWQEHRSGWMPEDFDDSWDLLISEDFHAVDNMGNKLETPFGTIRAIKTINVRDDNQVMALSKRRKLHKLLDNVLDLWSTWRFK